MTCSYIWPTNLYLWRQEACGIGCLMKGSTKLKQRFLVSSFFPPSLRLCDPEKENTFFGLGRPFFFVLYFFPFFVFIFLLADRTVAQKRATKRGGRREAPPPFCTAFRYANSSVCKQEKKKQKKREKSTTQTQLWRQEACGIGCLMRGPTKLKQHFLVSSFFPLTFFVYDTIKGMGRSRRLWKGFWRRPPGSPWWARGSLRSWLL